MGQLEGVDLMLEFGALGIEALEHGVELAGDGAEFIAR